ncbi:MAG: hypothetical protein ACREJD_10255 [Phycisphaerales bacterium]
MGKRICYIVGAGGSCAYDLPNGKQLVEQMMELRGQGTTPEERHEQFARLRARLTAANPDSIDEYIQELSEAGHDSQSQLKASAAYGVAVVLLRAQLKHEITNKRPDDWLYHLTRRYRKNLMTLADPPEISFITFNYDLLIEHHLKHRLFGLLADDEKAEARLNQIPIIHYHGQLGPVVYPAPKPGTTGLQISRYAYERMTDVQDDSAYESSKSLRFFWETDSNSEMHEKAVRVLGSAEEIAVLGVGRAMDPMLSLLGALPARWWQGGRFHMSIYGLGDDAQVRVKQFVNEKGGTPLLQRMKASEFIQSLS